LTRRKGEVTSCHNERAAPFIVEVPVPLGGFGMTLDAVEAFHLDAPVFKGASRLREG
jgi:hypothetical protein